MASPLWPWEVAAAHLNSMLCTDWVLTEHIVYRTLGAWLKAPLKGFYTFEQSAHSPMFEEPAKMQHIFENDILPRTNSLADEK